MENWPFQEPPEFAVTAVRQVIDGRGWIHSVFHAAGDGSWHFVGPDAPQEEDAVVVSIGDMARYHPSILSLADLPRGWCAWRDAPGRPWQRATHYPFPYHGTTTDGDGPAEEGEEELWTAPQYGLGTLLGIVTVFAVVFSFIAALKVDWGKGLFGAMILAIAVWTVVNVVRMVRLPEKARETVDRGEHADYSGAERADNK